MVYQRFDYLLDYTNYFEVGMYVSTILYVAADLNFSSDAIAGERYDSELSRVLANAIDVDILLHVHIVTR